MNTRRRFALAGLLVALSLALSVYAFPRVPDQVATHWNAAGEVDGTMGKLPGLFFVPALSAVLLGVFAVLPRIDPLGRNVAAFRRYYDWFVVLFAGFMLYVHGSVVAYNLGYPVDPGVVVLPAVGLLYLYVGVLLANARRNWFVGIRTPWTMSSDEVWRRTHRLGSRLFYVSGVLALLGAFVPAYAIWLVVGPAVATSVATVAYSFVAYRRYGGDGDPATG